MIGIVVFEFFKFHFSFKLLVRKKEKMVKEITGKILGILRMKFGRHPAKTFVNKVLLINSINIAFLCLKIKISSKFFLVFI